MPTFYRVTTTTTTTIIIRATRSRFASIADYENRRLSRGIRFQCATCECIKSETQDDIVFPVNYGALGVGRKSAQGVEEEFERQMFSRTRPDVFAANFLGRLGYSPTRPLHPEEVGEQPRGTASRTYAHE